jgi:YD repeat-containing protein
MSYDALDQLTGMSGAGAEVATTGRAFTYDDAGRMLTASGSGGTNTLAARSKPAGC